MLHRRTFLWAAGLALALPRTGMAQAFDHGHGAWTALLRRHVVLLEGGKASQLRYAGMASERAALEAYLATLSAVAPAAFEVWSKPQQMAFLINAYNAFTVKFVLGRYPGLASIRDLGSLLQSPWKQKFAPLLGATITLDAIEHDMLRARGRYDDARIHFAVNCASIGCPMLREEAYVPDRLEAQLDQQVQRFLSDRSRNRWNAGARKLEVSKIFDWYGDDFRQSRQGAGSLEAWFATHADWLADGAAERELIRARQAPIGFLDYDWKLNDARG